MACIGVELMWTLFVDVELRPAQLVKLSPILRLPNAYPGVLITIEQHGFVVGIWIDVNGAVSKYTHYSVALTA